MSFYRFLRTNGARIYDRARLHPGRYLCCLLCFFIGGGSLYWYVFERLPARNWNPSQIRKLNNSSPADLRFVVMGDNKDNFSILDIIFRQIDNEPGVSFALNLGDLVDTGDEMDFRRFLNSVNRHLHIPLLTVIGNHDLGEGVRGLYRTVFGPNYYSFTVGQNYFIALDDADRDGLDERQFEWLAQELEKAQNYAARIILMHIPPYNPSGFAKHHCLNESVAGRLMDLLAKYRATQIFAGHIHGYYTGQWRGIPYVISGGAGADLMGRDTDHFFYHYLVVQVKNGALTTKVRKVTVP